MGLGIGGVAGPVNRPPVGVGRVSQSGAPLWFLPPIRAGDVSARQRRLAAQPAAAAHRLDRFGGNKTKCRGVLRTERSQNVLPLGPDEDGPLSPAIGRLMLSRHESPNILRAIHFARPEPADFIRAHAGQPLEPNHRRDRGRQIRQDGIDQCVVHGLDRLVLRGLCVPVPQARHRLQRLPSRRGHKLLARGPLEHSADQVREPVAVGPRRAPIDEPLANRL